MCEVATETKTTIAPELELANLLKADLGIEINPQALRMWVRWRWQDLIVAAHQIHRAEFK